MGQNTSDWRDSGATPQKSCSGNKSLTVTPLLEKKWGWPKGEHLGHTEDVLSPSNSSMLLYELNSTMVKLSVCFYIE